MFGFNEHLPLSLLFLSKTGAIQIKLYHKPSLLNSILCSHCHFHPSPIFPGVAGSAHLYHRPVLGLAPTQITNIRLGWKWVAVLIIIVYWPWVNHFNAGLVASPPVVRPVFKCLTWKNILAY
jgi:hypothetical protein